MTEFIFFILGVIFGIGLIIALCFKADIYDVAEEQWWRFKYYLKTKGLLK